jgi:4-methyl-5(b-hydroxyethyl)-thiazole monophosphate biosynthesis
MASVLLPLAEGFEEVEAVGLIDVMRRGGIEVRVAYIDDSLGHGKVVIGANGIGVKADTALKNVISEDFDMMVLPGGWDGTYALAEHARVITLVQEFKAKKIIGAMCADHPGYREDMKVVTDGNVMTSRGPGTAVCFGLAIVERLVGKESMQAVKDGMLLDYC